MVRYVYIMEIFLHPEEEEVWMKVTVLGKYGPFPGPGGACSGYLIEEGAAKVLIDCGNGVLARLQKICPVWDLTAIILSHLHSDHISDMMVLRYALSIWAARGMMEDKPLKVYAPPEPGEEFERLFYQNVYDIEPILEGTEIPLGELNVRFWEMTHPIQSFGMEITNGTKKLFYTGDTNWNDRIGRIAAGSDLFMADTGLLARDKTGPNVPHLTAEEVGRIAAEAGVKKLMVTHVWPGYAEQDLVNEVSEHYPAAFIPQEMGIYEI